MEHTPSTYDITHDDLGRFQKNGPAFATFGETMLRETPADFQRPEMTRLVHMALGGSEFSVAVMMSRLGIPSVYITRVPDNPYGWMLRDTARANGIHTDHFVWAHQAEPMGRYIYEGGHTPRVSRVWYQRMFSAASRLAAGMVDWDAVLRQCKLLHVSGITFGLARHSDYAENYLLGAFHEALATKPANCWVGLDFNYRSTLWGVEECTQTVTPLVEQHVDILITSIYDMARFYGIGCGRYTASQVLNGETDDLHDDDLRTFGRTVIDRFNLRVLAITMRQPENSETHLWESAAFGRDGSYYRSLQPRPITLVDRIGGGDAWSGGFYYGLLTEDDSGNPLAKGVLVGDAATRLQQTIMFDLPIIQPAEIQALLEADSNGSGHQTVR
ncbi:MAG: sugar kinase [Anaerolineaceae bacterium]|nr:sugar kinase [Anaerolineaceae bacterium]